jgi:hypothetical protein
VTTNTYVQTKFSSLFCEHMDMLEPVSLDIYRFTYTLCSLLHGTRTGRVKQELSQNSSPRYTTSCGSKPIRLDGNSRASLERVAALFCI